MKDGHFDVLVVEPKLGELVDYAAAVPAPVRAVELYLWFCVDGRHRPDLVPRGAPRLPWNRTARPRPGGAFLTYGRGMPKKYEEPLATRRQRRSQGTQKRR